MKDAKQYIGSRVKELRLAKCITQKELSEKANVIRANISRIENGKYNTSIDILNRIAEALGVQVDFITKIED